MKKGLLFFIVTIFYFLTPVCFISVAGTMVSLKYEVDEAHIFVDINKKTTDTEKNQRNKDIEEHEKDLKLSLNLWTTGLVLFSLTATGLLIFKKKLNN